MMRMKAVNEEIYVADQRIANAGKSDLQFLKDKVAASARKRIRVCAHKNNDDKLHEMFIVLGKGTYIRPSMHLNKEESLHCLEGFGQYVFFDEQGKIAKVVRLGDYKSGRQFYVRTPASVYHTLILESDVFAMHETTQGPFRKSDTVYADWAPLEGEPDAVARYVQQLKTEIALFLQKETP